MSWDANRTSRRVDLIVRRDTTDDEYHGFKKGTLREITLRGDARNVANVSNCQIDGSGTGKYAPIDTKYGVRNALIVTEESQLAFARRLERSFNLLSSIDDSVLYDTGLADDELLQKIADQMRGN